VLRHASTLLTLLVSVAILILGHGLHLAVLPLRAEALGWTGPQIGLSGSCYFAGLLMGCFSVPALVRSVGHIRVFTVLTAIMTAALLLLSMIDNYPAWLVLRFLAGGAIAGLYLIIESWLNETVDNRERGAAVALYTIVVLLAMAGGQLLINVAAPDSFEIVIVASLFVVIAAVPIGLTRTPQPRQIPAARFSPLLVLKTSHAAAAASFVSGVATGCFYALGPIYGKAVGLELSAISLMMASGVAGGAVFLWPMGKLSDVMDRRAVILASLLIGIVACVLATSLSKTYLPMVMFLFGGAVLPVYALSLAHAGDSVTTSFLEVGTGILMINSVGAILGPLTASICMRVWGPNAFFVYCAVSLSAGAVVVAALLLHHRARRPHYAPFAPATTETTQGAVELDPRSDGNAALPQRPVH
jgi:MFS family permease